ncbi:MAG: aldo/keto reductase [Cyanobacteriota bacterium]
MENNNLSKLSYGSLILSSKLQEDISQSTDIINYVLDSGINIIDTAYYYGKNSDDIGSNERFLSQILGDRIKELNIATKGGYYLKNNVSVINNKKEFLIDSCNLSLKNLNLDQIYLYQLHVFDKNESIDNITDTINFLKNENKIKYFGLSNIELMELHNFNQKSQIYSVQNKFNPFFQKDLKTGFLEYCKDNNIIYFAYGIFNKNNNTLLDNLLNDLSKKYNTSSEIISLLWIKSKGKHIIPIISSTKKENINKCIFSYNNLNLDEEDILRIDRI